MRTIKLNITCPVCTQSLYLGQSECCTECGWLPILYAAPLDLVTKALLQQQLDVAISSYEQLRIMLEETLDFQRRVDEITPIHQMLGSQYTEIAPNYNALQKELDEVRASYVLVDDTNDLEKEFRKLIQIHNEFLTKVPSGYHNRQSPSVTFACKYIGETDNVEVEILEVFNHVKEVNHEIVFAVAFFEKDALPLHEAALIIPIEPIQNLYFKPGDVFNFKLKYSPLGRFKKKFIPQVTHLVYFTLSHFFITTK